MNVRREGGKAGARGCGVALSLCTGDIAGRCLLLPPSLAPSSLRPSPVFLVPPFGRCHVSHPSSFLLNSRSLPTRHPHPFLLPGHGRCCLPPHPPPPPPLPPPFQHQAPSHGRPPPPPRLQHVREAIFPLRGAPLYKTVPRRVRKHRGLSADV